MYGINAMAILEGAGHESNKDDSEIGEDVQRCYVPKRLVEYHRIIPIEVA